MGHGLTLHTCWIEVRLLHAEPPLRAGVTTDLVSVCTPLPQVTEHADQAPQSDITQSCGQSNILQGLTSAVWLEHGTPEPRAGRITILLLTVCPPPQVALHADQSNHSESWQSTGQSIAPQVWLSTRISVSVSVVTIPLALVVMVTVVVFLWRVCKPPPHDLVHMLHELHSEMFHETLPTTGGGLHWGAVHDCVSISDPHATPPLAAGLETVRVRVCWPVSHAPLLSQVLQLKLHTLHAPHSAITQSVGHAWVLQGAWSSVFWHAWPPFAAGTSTKRCLFMAPPPHVAEHVDHACHSLIWQSNGHGLALPHVSTETRAGQACPPHCAA